jgi:hypothetical protein|tara:strand:- start:77 stop:415 length:339 start_codon:yes stop_codon:yes gene_type:complete
MVLLVSLIGLRNLEEKKNYQGKATLVIITLGETIQEEVDIGGLSVLDILNKNHDIKTLQTPTSKRLTCIDGVCAKGGFWWQFFVNEELVLSSVDKYYPKEGEIILLEYGEEE